MKITAKVVPYSSVVGSSVTLHAESGMTICQLSLLSVIPPNFTFTPELHKQTSVRITEWVASALNNGPAFEAEIGSGRTLADATPKSPESDLSSLRKGAEVAVKPLEWRSFGIHWTASAGFAGVYAVFLGEREQYQLRRDGIILGNFAEAEAAKSAAQCDFETRIRSALVSGSREEQADG